MWPGWADQWQSGRNLATVQNGTAWAPVGCHDGSMLHKQKKAGKQFHKVPLASIQKEMAQPRKARSARIAERKLDPAQMVEDPSVHMPGTVDKIIPGRHPGRPEKAQIAVDGADRRRQDLRIENELIDEDGDEVKLKKGAHVQVTVSAEPKK
jgi:hypothetical protein